MLQRANVRGAKISELVFVTINMKKLNMTSLTSLSDVVPATSNVARHAGNALIASSCYTGRAIGEHGDSKRALLVAVEEVTVNHDGLLACHDRNCHRVCFRFTRGSGDRIGNKEEKLINPPLRRPSWQPVEQESSQLPNDKSQNQTKLGLTAV